MITPRISFLIVLATYIWLNLSIAAPMTVSQNNKFIYVGTCSVNTASTFNNNSAIAWNPLQYTVTYPITFGVVSTVQVYISIKSLHVTIALNRISFHGQQNSITTSSFNLTLNSNFTNYIKRLEYSYLIIANIYVDNYMKCFTITQPLYAYITLTNSFSQGYPYTYLFVAGGVSILIFFTAFDLNTTSNEQIVDVGISGTVTTSQISILIFSNSAISTFIHKVTFNCLIYSTSYYNRQNTASFVTQGIVGAANSSALQYTNNSNVYSLTTMVGLSSISIKGDNFLDFSINYNNPNGFAVTSANQITSFKVSYMTLSIYYCAYTTPFYYQNICYDACPERTYQHLPSLSCLPCSYDCYTCKNSHTCFSCNGQNEHRILDNSTHRCIPMQGYYDIIGWRFTMQCSYPCAACTSDKDCTACFQGYILSNQNRCQICIDCSSSRSDNTGVIIGLVVVAVVVIVIVVYFCYIYKQIRERLPPLINAVVPPELDNSSLSLDHVVPVVLGEWRPRTRETSMTQECSIDLLDQAYFKTNCNHYFHIKCIIEWSKRDNRCPNCRHPNFSEKDHKVFCKQCRRKEKHINFKELVRSYEQDRIEEQMRCPDCRIIPI